MSAGTLFWILAAIMIVATLAIILPPLLKPRALKTVQRDVLNAAIYKDQLAELSADLSNQTLSPEQYEQGRSDLERNLLTDVSDPQEEIINAGRNVSTATGRITAVLVGIGVPVLAIGLYLQLSKDYDVFADQPMSATSAQPGMESGFTPEMMVQRLSERLKTNPKDGAGWAMLGRSYAVLGRHGEASQAYAKALPLVKEDAQLLVDYAEAAALSNSDQQLAGKPTELFEKALKLDADNPKGLWLAGMAAYQKEDYRAASAYWKRLMLSMPADSPDAIDIQKNIAEADARAAGGNMPR